MTTLFRRLALGLGLVLGLAGAAAAQTYTITPTPFQTAFTNAGALLNNGCIWTYSAGTSTPATTYADTAGTPNLNPIRSGSDGRFTAYLVAGSNYKFVYETACTPPAHGSVLRTADNILGVPGSAATVDQPATAGESLTAGQAVYLSAGDGGKTAGFWYKADSANAYSASTYSVGMATANMAALGTGTVRIAGQITTGLSSLTVGGMYYVGTAGAITTTPPTIARKLGQADSATSLVLEGNPAPFAGTAFGVQYFNSGTSPASTVAGTTGQVLGATTGAAPAFVNSAGVGGSLVLLKYGSGTSTAAGTTNVDTLAIAAGALTVQDRLIIYTSLETVTQATAGAQIYDVTDAQQIAYLAGNGGLTTAAGAYFEQVDLVMRRQASALLLGSGTRGFVANNTQTAISGGFTLTTAWTGARTIALRHTGVTAGGTLNWEWWVYKVLGQ